MSNLLSNDLHSLVSTLNGGSLQQLAVPAGLAVMVALMALTVFVFLKKSVKLGFAIWIINNVEKKAEIEQVRIDYPSMELCKTSGKKCYLVLCKNQKQANKVEDNHKTNGYPTVYFDGDKCSLINQNVKMSNVTYINKTPTDKEIVSLM